MSMDNVQAQTAEIKLRLGKHASPELIRIMRKWADDQVFEYARMLSDRTQLPQVLEAVGEDIMERSWRGACDRVHVRSMIKAVFDFGKESNAA
jgi:hypothetical protein